MKVLLTRLRATPTRWKWAALLTLAVAAVLLIWFFFFRATPGSPSGSTAPPLPRLALGKRIPYEQYTVAVDRALADVREAQSLSGDDRKKKLQDAASALGQVEGASVSPPAGGTTEIDNTEVITELRSDKPNLVAAEGSLSSLAQSLHTQGQDRALGGTLDGEQAKAELKKVLSDPAFNYERELSPLQKLARWLAGRAGAADPNDILWRIVTAFMAALAGGALIYLATDRIENKWVRWGLSVVGGLVVGGIFYMGTGDLGQTAQVLGAIGLLVAAVAAALIFGGLRRASAPSGRPRQVSDLAAALGMSAAEARKRAEEAATAEDYRLAIRFRCLAVLLALDEVGMLAFDRAATDREYLFRAPGTLQDELQPLLARFEQVWYGDSPATATDWSDYNARATRLEARVAAEAVGKRIAA